MEYEASKLTPETTPADAEEAYPLVKDLIFDQVYKHYRAFGGDFDDLVGEAHLAFVRGHKQFMTGQSKRGVPVSKPFASEIRFWVWAELFDKMRARATKNTRHPTVSTGDIDMYSDKDYDFEYNTWVEELSENARYVVGLMIQPPEEVVELAEAKGGEPRNYRSTVRDYLKGCMWGRRRIETTYQEIKEALG